ncbi:PREDICTED: calmodulin-binding transcription activator 5 [Ceratosolen solmsi marchali]|uniref:Calmodulin-binding transcription activator 5 n=1 Tax=Ceratosolen solmsi marchali TaxID=326594 RepID=A0AAJ6YTZ4_9HYME|nr:PREDICTED: calmodulin-binding transcription activator 5 [Ceratosolen solmsi marchali]
MRGPTAGGPRASAEAIVRFGESRMSVEKPLVDVQDANEAAAKIQAGFRGYRVRKRLQEERRAKEQQPEEARDGTTQEPQRRMEVPRSALEDESATKIQASVRGFLVRKRHEAERAAATRIQAGFRGFRTRKILQQNGK